MAYRNYSTSSGVKTASSQISTNPGALIGIDATPPEDCNTVIKIWDSENSTTSGKTVLAEIHLDAGHLSINHEYFVPVAVNRGIYAELTTTASGDNGTFVVRYMAG